jgi:NTE family protein
MPSPRTALILTGGGARAGYQVGVLKAIREMLPEPRRNPFPILCGTSAGAINAASMAVWAEDFGGGVDNLLNVWENFSAHQVYRADPGGLGVAGARAVHSCLRLADTSCATFAARQRAVAPPARRKPGLRPHRQCH